MGHPQPPLFGHRCTVGVLPGPTGVSRCPGWHRDRAPTLVCGVGLVWLLTDCCVGVSVYVEHWHYSKLYSFNYKMIYKKRYIYCYWHVALYFWNYVHIFLNWYSDVNIQANEKLSNFVSCLHIYIYIYIEIYFSCFLMYFWWIFSICIYKNHSLSYF